jgi:serine/threonine-protein kinase HipA
LGFTPRLETLKVDLEVRYGGRRVGALRADDANRFCFQYVDEWLNAHDAFPVSITLPLGSEEEVGGPAHAFFANLLPEASVRQAVCRRLGISESNDVELLRAIGGDCAGALSIVEVNTPLEQPENEYEELDPERLQRLTADDGGIVPLLIGGAETRLSLAGAQEKIPVAILDGKIYLPLKGSPSTHILKLPNPRYAHLTQNEAFVLGVAARAGLECASSELTNATKPQSLLVERYDRRRTDDPWPARRLHQEDFCQALGLLPARKYEQEGGPTLAQSVEVVRTGVADPLRDVQRLIEWQAFNTIVGNADGHGKNLSILYDDTGARLAPFYDLVSTREYSSLDRRLAMSVGGRRNADEVGRAQWQALASELEMRDRVVLELVVRTLDRVDDALPKWTRAFRDLYGDLPILQTLPARIAKQLRRLRRAIEATGKIAKAENADKAKKDDKTKQAAKADKAHKAEQPAKADKADKADKKQRVKADKTKKAQQAQKTQSKKNAKA